MSRILDPPIAANMSFDTKDDLRERSFFPVLTDFLSSSPVVAMVWSGEDIVVQG